MSLEDRGAVAGVCVRVEALHATAEGDAISVSLTLYDAAGHSEKKELRVRTELFGDLGIHKGEIPPEKYEALEKADALSRAYSRGAGMLSYGANSVRRLSQKLTQKGFDRDTALAAAEMLERQGYIRETSDACREADRCLCKGWGARRILVQLRQHGYGDEAVAEAEEYLSGVDFTPVCRQVAQTLSRRPPTERAEREKIAAALFRRGFSGEEIKEALRTAWTDGAE